MPALEGLFQVLQPKGVILRSASIAWSNDIDGWSYDRARGSLASSISGLGRAGSIFNAIDTSMLLDVETEGFTGQIEWGVVSAPELQARVETPQMGRLSAQRARASLSPELLADLPLASVFLDSHLHQTESVTIENAEGMKSAIQTVTGISEYVCQQLATDTTSKIGDGQ